MTQSDTEIICDKEKLIRLLKGVDKTKTPCWPNIVQGKYQYQPPKPNMDLTVIIVSEETSFALSAVFWPFLVRMQALKWDPCGLIMKIDLIEAS